MAAIRQLAGVSSQDKTMSLPRYDLSVGVDEPRCLPSTFVLDLFLQPNYVCRLWTHYLSSGIEVGEYVTLMHRHAIQRERISGY